MAGNVAFEAIAAERLDPGSPLCGVRDDKGRRTLFSGNAPTFHLAGRPSWR